MCTAKALSIQEPECEMISLDETSYQARDDEDRYRSIRPRFLSSTL